MARVPIGNSRVSLAPELRLTVGSVSIGSDTAVVRWLFLVPAARRWNHFTTVCVFVPPQGMRMSGEAGEVLHLVGVERESAGNYACLATNTEGETTSSNLTLRVQCKCSSQSFLSINSGGVPGCSVRATSDEVMMLIEKPSWSYVIWVGIAIWWR